MYFLTFIYLVFTQRRYTYTIYLSCALTIPLFLLDVYIQTMQTLPQNPKEFQTMVLQMCFKQGDYVEKWI